jgi:hypothetical protein
VTSSARVTSSTHVTSAASKENTVPASFPAAQPTASAATSLPTAAAIPDAEELGVEVTPELLELQVGRVFTRNSKIRSDDTKSVGQQKLKSSNFCCLDRFTGPGGQG